MSFNLVNYVEVDGHWVADVDEASGETVPLVGDDGRVVGVPPPPTAPPVQGDDPGAGPSDDPTSQPGRLPAGKGSPETLGLRLPRFCPIVAGLWCGERDSVVARITQASVRSARIYLPSNQKEVFKVFSIVEAVLVTGVAGGATIVNVTVVCPAAIATGGPVGAAACAFSTAATGALTVAAAAAAVKEARLYIEEQRTPKRRAR